MWFVLALLSALFQVLRNISMKHLGHELDDIINVWGRFTFLLPFVALASGWHGMPELKAGFWPCVIGFGITQSIATLSLSKALKLSGIAIVTSLWKLSLLFLVVFAYVTLDETPSAAGLAGVLLSTVGVYLLNVQKSRISVWAPLRELLVDPGLRYTLAAAFFYAPSVVLIKLLILVPTSTSPTSRATSLPPSWCFRWRCSAPPPISEPSRATARRSWPWACARR